jgi:hypothetical protein
MTVELAADSGSVVAGILVWVLLFLVGGLIGSAIGKSKGRSLAGFWLGGFLWFIGWLIVAVMAPTPEAEAKRTAAVVAATQSATALGDGTAGGGAAATVGGGSTRVCPRIAQKSSRVRRSCADSAATKSFRRCLRRRHRAPCNSGFPTQVAVTPIATGTVRAGLSGCATNPAELDQKTRRCRRRRRQSRN